MLALGAAGIRVYGAWSWLRGPRPTLPLPLDDMRRILVIRVDLLGDVVLSIPALQALRNAFPLAEIDVLTLPFTAPVLEHVAGLHAIYRIDVNAYRRPEGLLAIGKLVRTIQVLRRRRYDLAIGLSGLMGGVFAVLTGARIRVGYGGETFPGAYNAPVPGARYLRAQHEVEYGVDLVRALVPSVGGATRAHPSISWQPATGGPIATTPIARAYAVLVPGATNGAAKRWPASKWAELADRLVSEWHLDVIWSGSSVEAALVRAIQDQMATPSLNLAGKTSIDDLMALLAGARVVVAGDTGPLHLAAALGRPVVGIFGPTDPVSSGPRSEDAAVVRAGLPCSPCYDMRTPADCKLPDRGMPCMWNVGSNQVLAAIGSVLLSRPADQHVH